MNKQPSAVPDAMLLAESRQTDFLSAQKALFLAQSENIYNKTEIM